VSSDKFECEVMNWELFYSLSREVAIKIVESGYEPDFVVGLARGGWVLSRVLCDFLGVKDLVSLKVEHWGITATPNGKAQIKYPFEINLTGRLVLVVDDITDTGESMRVATEYVKTLNPKEIRTAALRHITGSGVVPDYFGDEISWRWVIFPWNYVEDMCNILPKVLAPGGSLADMKVRLKENYNIDIDEREIKKLLRELERRSKA
jgi:hypoxanthine phosphoribosyltransferase